MKAVIILAILITIGIIFFQYKKEKNLKKFLITLATFSFLISIAIIGNLTRPILPIYVTHMVLVMIAWGSVFMYIFKNKYCWWWIIAPLITIGLFLGLEFMGGSAHELG